jgi:hypothetical protein
MKKLSVILLVIMMVYQASAQKSFYSGAFVFSANYGIDGNIANQHYFNQSENTAQTLNGMAPASNLSLDAEYGLLSWLGVGVVGRFDNYFSENNQVTNTTTTAGAVDWGVTGNIHFLRMSHFDLFAGLDWGISQFTYHINNDINTMASGNGNWSDIHATGRLYFGRLGVNLSLYVPTMSYSSLQSSNYSAGEYVVNYWKSTGYGASVGLEYRLF